MSSALTRDFVVVVIFIETRMSSRQNVKAVLTQKNTLDNVQWQIRHKKDLSTICKVEFWTKMSSRQNVKAILAQKRSLVNVQTQFWDKNELSTIGNVKSISIEFKNY